MNASNIEDKGRKLMVVDDEAVIRIRLKDLGNNLGMNVKTAGDGAEGWQVYQQFKPDLAILDIYMPVMNGLVLMKKIKESDPHCPVILISAYLDYDELTRWSPLKPDGFVPKPFKFDEISEMMLKLLNPKESELCEPELAEAK
ncbi:MAG: response regulator [bacterium]|nr:response regulator [bacterium]